MALESWFKIGLPAFPLGFTLLGAWLYWGDNPLALLPPPLAFWGVVVLFYLFSHLYVPNRRYPLVLTIFASVLWLVASITAHNLGRFLSSSQARGVSAVMANKDFWYAYISAAVGCVVALRNFLRYEPIIVDKSRRDRDAVRF
jgi:Na+/citrate or Na+/malate symporter